MEHEQEKSGRSITPTLTVFTFLLVMYFAFPVFLLYPILKMDTEGKHLPVYLKDSLELTFTPVMYLCINSTKYKKWLRWQSEILGVQEL